jgi:hypothetical protein
MGQMDLTDTYRILHPTAVENTFFSAANGTFSKIYHTLGYKTSLDKYKKIEIISYILLYHNGIKLEIKKQEKCTNTWRMNNTVLNNHLVIEEIRGEIKKIPTIK